ncbi:hypothetical protein BTJ68_02472 [Lecanosticta acicola]|uniref:FAD dependent oxidoreductase domain-containing protein n=1 Tax=Lecanosticta acicola TaxID=111012 RepID=A0AAI8YSF0_9PEZI|nr:hypothetical protein BTJ68_02472 [Lecanosticta acicola]
MPEPESTTVIIGAGIIGCATAYYLSHSHPTKPQNIHLIDSSPEIFASASGKAGGFLASDWFGPATASLGALSFRLHEALARENDGYKRWGYSRSTGTSLVDGGGGSVHEGDWLAEGGSRAEAAGMHEYGNDGVGPRWLKRRKGDYVEVISEEGGVAQVDPLRLSKFLLGESLDKGVRLHQPARAVKLVTGKDGVMKGLRVRKDRDAEDGAKEEEIPCTRLLITAGAWTAKVFASLFPGSKLRIPVSPLAGHSVVVRSPRWTREHQAEGCHAIFTTMQNGFSPEIFSRIGEEIYIAGLNSPSIPLPDVATDAKIDQESIKELMEVSQRLLGKDGTDLSDIELLRGGLCFRPVTPNESPILAKVSGKQLGDVSTSPNGGVFVCAGHGPWGISHSLGTGKVMAEMLEGQKTSADIKRLGMP